MTRGEQLSDDRRQPGLYYSRLTLPEPWSRVETSRGAGLRTGEQSPRARVQHELGLTKGAP